MCLNGMTSVYVLDGSRMRMDACSITIHTKLLLIHSTPYNLCSSHRPPSQSALLFLSRFIATLTCPHHIQYKGCKGASKLTGFPSLPYLLLPLLIHDERRNIEHHPSNFYLMSVASFPKPHHYCSLNFIQGHYF